MITNLRLQDADTALVEGPRFDTQSVTEAAIAFLREFVGAIVQADPSVTPTIKFSGDHEEPSVLDDDGYARMRRELMSCAILYEVDACCARIDVGSYRLRCYLHGEDDLFQWSGEEPALSDGELWSELDPTPIIRIEPRGTELPFFGPHERHVVMAALEEAAPPGVTIAKDSMPTLRFEHNAFGDGHGTLRVSLQIVPEALDPVS